MLPHDGEGVFKTAQLLRVINKYLLDFVEGVCKTGGLNLFHENNMLRIYDFLTDFVLQVSGKSIEKSVNIALGHFIPSLVGFSV